VRLENRLKGCWNRRADAVLAAGRPRFRANPPFFAILNKDLDLDATNLTGPSCSLLQRLSDIPKPNPAYFCNLNYTILLIRSSIVSSAPPGKPPRAGSAVFPHIFVIIQLEDL
jgi:hypothetical protein